MALDWGRIPEEVFQTKSCEELWMKLKMGLNLWAFLWNKKIDCSETQTEGLGWTFGRVCRCRNWLVFLKNRKYLYILWAIAFQLIYILNWNFKELCCHPWWMFNINIWPNLGSYNFCTKLKILWLKLKM